jgi:hypothetical protein
MKNARERKNHLYSKLSGNKRIRAIDTAPLEPERCRRKKSKNENFCPSIRKNGSKTHSASALASMSIVKALSINIIFIYELSV